MTRQGRETVSNLDDDAPTGISPRQNTLHRDAVATAITAWVTTATTPGGRDAPEIRLQAVERIAGQVEELLAEERRRAALFALGMGRSIAATAAELGLSRWALTKRWPDLAEQARPLRWLFTNQDDWADAVDELLGLVEPLAEQLGEEPRRELGQLRVAVDRYRARGRDWWALQDTPRMVRAALATMAPTPDDEVGMHVLSDWLFAQLADYDLTSSGEKKHPRTEVSRAAVRAATEARLARR